MSTPRRRKFKAEEPPQQQPATVPSSFRAAISRVAIAQICLATGYSAAEPFALRALSDIATRYLQALGRAAASVATAHHRTDSNLLDLVRAIEDLSAAKGFPGGSDPTGQPLRSGALRELEEFVESVEEIPFAKPIPRGGKEEEELRTTWRSFAAAGREPPRHVPSWLPCFPEESGNKEKKGLETEEQRTTMWRSFSAAGRVPSPEDREMEMKLSTEKGRITAVELPAEREKVEFRLGFGKRRQQSDTKEKEKKRKFGGWRRDIVN